jgi:hypothetical protein
LVGIGVLGGLTLAHPAYQIPHCQANSLDSQAENSENPAEKDFTCAYQPIHSFVNVLLSTIVVVLLLGSTHDRGSFKTFSYGWHPQGDAERIDFIGF